VLLTILAFGDPHVMQAVVHGWPAALHSGNVLLSAMQSMHCMQAVAYFVMQAVYIDSHAHGMVVILAGMVFKVSARVDTRWTKGAGTPLPESATCARSLALPCGAYGTCADMRRQLLIAIEYGNVEYSKV
jgi:hypothetical protein